MGEVTCGGSPYLSCNRDQIKMRDYMDRQVTSPTWGRPTLSKQALNQVLTYQEPFYSSIYWCPMNNCTDQSNPQFQMGTGHLYNNKHRHHYKFGLKNK